MPEVQGLMERLMLILWAITQQPNHSELGVIDSVCKQAVILVYLLF